MKKNFRLVGLDCAHCASNIENDVKKINGVTSSAVNFMTTKLTIEFDDELKDSVLAELPKVVAKTDANIDIKKM